MTADDPTPDKTPGSNQESQPQLEPRKASSAKFRKPLIALALVSATVALVSTSLLLFSVLAEPRSASLSTASHSAIDCSDSTNCQNNPDAPVCGDRECAVCDPLTRKCIYRLKPNDPACDCLQYDVEICTLDGGGWGVRKCRVTLAGNETYWGRCAEL